MQLEPGTRVGAYTVTSTAGRGVAVNAYWAEDRADALWMLREFCPPYAWRAPNFSLQVPEPRVGLFNFGLARFIAEGHALMSCRHPAIPMVVAVVETFGTAYQVLATPRHGGHSLVNRLHEGPIGEHECRALFGSIIDALAAMHAAGVMHLNVNPGTLLFDPDGGALALFDFAQSRVEYDRYIRDNGLDVTLLLPGPYAAIELHGAALPIGPPADIYAVAAVLYETVTLYRPHTAPQRIRQDILIPAATAAKGRYADDFLAFVDAGLRLHADERPATIPDWTAMLQPA